MITAEFVGFPSIVRTDKMDCVITEKIDGSNAQIFFDEDGTLWTGSRNRWITPEDDNFGFSAWAHNNREVLFDFFGYGRTFGEWFGGKIQRGYGLKQKMFMPFRPVQSMPSDKLLPPQVVVNSVLHCGPFSFEVIWECMLRLRENGSSVVPGFMNPEGIVCYFPHLKVSMKETFDGPKWKKKEKYNA